MTPLKREILAQIRLNGPMSLAEYMALCLGHPKYGYYTNRDPLGAGGDFITAPEISQIFGELIGLWIAQTWMDQGAPTPFVLAELGPGRGTLMKDALRAARRVPGFIQAAQICLIETSPALRAKQRETVTDPFAHLDRVEDLPDAPLFLIANEFFDALPIRQFHQTEDGWRERVVGAAGEDLVFGLSKIPSYAAALHATPVGAVRETCAAAEAITAYIAAHIARRGGAGLIIDYGYDDQETPARIDTFQAMSAHAYADPLDAPGDHDLTAHVNFTALAAAASQAGATPSRLISQGAFLSLLGAAQRAQSLTRANPAAADDVAAALNRLCAPDQMGTLFKCLAVTPPGGDALGFA